MSVIRVSSYMKANELGPAIAATTAATLCSASTRTTSLIPEEIVTPSSWLASLYKLSSSPSRLGMSYSSDVPPRKVHARAQLCDRVPFRFGIGELLGVDVVEQGAANDH